MEVVEEEIERQRAQLAKIRALHTRVDGGVFVDTCSCKAIWPCPTAQILEDT